MDVSKYRELTDEEVLRAYKMAIGTVEAHGDDFKNISGVDYSGTILGVSFQTALEMIIEEKNQKNK